MTEQLLSSENTIGSFPIHVTRLRSRVVSIPVKKKVVARVGSFTHIWFLLLDVETDAGITGSSYLWAFSPAGAAALQHVLEELTHSVIGENPFFTTGLWRKMWTQITQWGHKGLTVIAMSGIDIALWDIIGKVTQQPLSHILGAATDRVPTYASEGMWLTDDMAALAQEAEELVEQGFRAMKLRLGRALMRDDIEAVRVVRQAIGPDITLMVDANQGWDVKYTIRIGRKLEAFDLYWIEEPIAHDDLAGHAHIAQALDIPIASGENIYSPYGFRECVEQLAADILMADIERVGGVTGWMRVAAIAEAWHRPLCSHLFPEISIHLLAATPTSCYLEHMPWASQLFKEQLTMIDGAILVPQKPGLGFQWDEQAIRLLTP